MCPADLLVLSSYTGEMKTMDLQHTTKQPMQDVTVLQLKEEAIKAFLKLSGCSLDDVKLICEAKPLDKDSAPLSEYGIKPLSVVQMVRKVHGG